ncbi:hypothetical protein BEL04_00080 [Mucilaginibacter sp. PPCGB 2223]|uniref:hypothetical protein n=1 Tax=Mucilaginibacter sp. PPCGB 2223 TaxID=1886027 RepID=UPI0008264070|nr:hypothetical protein [Mucilaginibacter sp. PPCGB 2223]OCX52772.1 hypothetical protein BEL04_00080 [Mucilaginibacter sp. PPCGB 2223]
MYVVTQHAADVISRLEDAQDIGFTYVVFSSYPTERGLHPADLNFFDTMGDALDYWDDALGRPGFGIQEPDHPIYYIETDKLLEEVKKQNGLTKEKDMNYNNLENLKNELSKLGFGKKVMEDMQKQMEKGVPEFTVNDKVLGNRGQVDVSLHFKQSGQSENYYFNKYQVALSNAKPLEEGHKYMVISPNEQQPGKNLSRSFENVTEAIAYFKEQNGNSRLASGKDAAHATDLARMEKGSINYVEKEFAYAFKHPAKTQTFFVERGKGFTEGQAVNLIQGRAVFRDDLVSAVGQYQAWVKLDMDSAKDRYQNYTTLQYHVPTYGFDLQNTLDKFNIKELTDDKKRENLVQNLEQGNRPLVTVVKDDKESKLFMEVQPRYSQLNFFREDGKQEKREQFLKPEHQQEMKLGKEKSQAKEQEQDLAV